MADIIRKFITEIDADPELVGAYNLVLPVINTNKATLGMTAQQVTDLTTLCNSYITQYGTANTAKAAAKSAVNQKDTNRRNAKTAMNTWVKTWRANPAVPDALLEQLLCAPHNTTPNHTPPVAPTNLMALADGQGYVELRWKKSTNKPNTQYVVEKQLEAGGEFVFAGISTKTKFETQATPGQYVAYRVTANRAGESSNPTAPVVLWNNGGTGALRVAA